MLLLLAGLAGCKKNNTKPVFNGTYSGKFTHGMEKNRATTDSEINFSGNSYTSTLGSGTFTVQKNNVISFEDKNFYTTEFDWNMILKQDYTYQIKGDSLILTKKFPQVAKPGEVKVTDWLYQYRLKKKN